MSVCVLSVSNIMSCLLRQQFSWLLFLVLMLTNPGEHFKSLSLLPMISSHSSWLCCLVRETRDFVHNIIYMNGVVWLCGMFFFLWLLHETWDLSWAKNNWGGGSSSSTFLVFFHERKKCDVTRKCCISSACLFTSSWRTHHKYRITRSLCVLFVWDAFSPPSCCFGY